MGEYYRATLYKRGVNTRGESNKIGVQITLMDLDNYADGTEDVTYDYRVMVEVYSSKREDWREIRSIDYSGYGVADGLVALEDARGYMCSLVATKIKRGYQLVSSSGDWSDLEIANEPAAKRRAAARKKERLEDAEYRRALNARLEASKQSEQELLSRRAADYDRMIGQLGESW